MTQNAILRYSDTVSTDNRKEFYLIQMSKKNSSLQMKWGILLLLAGLGVFFMTPQKMREIEKIEHFDIAIDVEGSKKGSAPKSVVDYAISKRDDMV